MSRAGWRVPWMVARGMIVLAPGVVACSGEDFTSTGSVPWTSRTLDTLSTPEQQQLCDELRTEVAATTNSDVYRAWSCTVEAWTGSQSGPDATRVTRCQGAFESCMGRTDVSLTTNIHCDEIVPSLNLACTTVGAMRGCYHLWGPAIEQGYNTTLQDLPASCAEAEQAGGVIANLTGVEIDVPPECLDIRAGCGL